MADKTGRALGTLSAAIYFKDPKGHIVLPPMEIGQGQALARRAFEEKYRPKGYEWCEAGTLQEVDKLQAQLVDQETRVRAAQGQRLDDVREKVRRETTSDLRQRMQSSDCSPFEREFIQLWLAMDEQKRKEFTQRFTERNDYLWACAMDSKSKIEDRMGDG